MNKFRARKTVLDGLTFDSAGEARRWQELKLLERAGAIRNLQRQIKLPLSVAGSVVCHYVADFGYFDAAKGRSVYEDFKGFRTPEYRLKAKMFRALYDVELVETGSPAKPRRRRSPAKEAA